METDKHIVLFDGTCNFCNFWVNFVIKRDKNDVFRFASLQSDTGQSLSVKFQVSNEVDSVVFIKNGQVYIKSDAALELVRDLSGLWFLLFGFKIVPTFIRDWIYDIVAKYRYKWFGKQLCEIAPKNENKHKFL
ncbi:MAG: thiol-disulfide oxidoreductase DCC family protein [Flavobacteriales bacterium]